MRPAAARSRSSVGWWCLSPTGQPLVSLRRAQACSPISPDASPCPALLSTARLYDDKSRSDLRGTSGALAAGPDNAGYRRLGPRFYSGGTAILSLVHLMSVPGPPGCG